MKTIIYSELNCPACEALKEWARVQGVAYTEAHHEEIIQHPERNEIMGQLASQGMSLPVIWHQGQAMSAAAFKLAALKA